MNSRTRLIKTLNHEEPDKVPLDLGGFQTGIHIKAYKRLLDYLEIVDDNIQYYDYLQQLAIPCEKLLKRFEIDTKTIHLPATFLPEDANIEIEYDKWLGYWDKFGIFWGRPKDSKEKLLYNDRVHPFEDFTTVEEIKKYNWPDGKDRTSLKGLKEYTQNLFENTNYALIGRSMGCLFQWTHYLFGFQKALIHILKRPDLMIAAMQGLLNHFSDFAEIYLREVGKYIQTVQITSDLSDQKGPMLSPRLYRKIIRPTEQEFARRLHEMANVKINYHCCGSPIQFIPDFVEMGYNSLNPVQVSAFDMDPCELKRRFGDKITFWGGLCDTQKTLPFGTPEEIRKEVKYNMGCLKNGGGYIAANIHNIVYDVKPENITAMFDAAIEFRDY